MLQSLQKTPQPLKGGRTLRDTLRHLFPPAMLSLHMPVQKINSSEFFRAIQALEPLWIWIEKTPLPMLLDILLEPELFGTSFVFKQTRVLVLGISMNLPMVNEGPLCSKGLLAPCNFTFPQKGILLMQFHVVRQGFFCLQHLLADGTLVFACV